ncbi:MSCRAMM family protein [Nocardia callitridis]|uniref:SD-repeat containing protein B domain-containing protein n=1 Tax=Nocardia callitridis TaxID=648753 RepID=A0ABP9K465_9NOCA
MHESNAFSPRSSNTRDGATLRGRADNGRAGVAGVAVTLADRTGAQVGLTHTDADGEFAVTGLPVGSYLAVFSHRGYDPHAVMVTLTANAAALAVTLTPSTSVRGRVTHLRDGQPVPDATLTAIGADGEVLTSDVTDVTGHYRLTEIHADEITLVLAAPGADPVATVVSCADGTEHTVDLSVDVRSVLGGTVTYGGEPVAGLRLTLRDRHGVPIATTNTDKAGAYRFDRVDAGSYTVDSAASGPRAVSVGADTIDVDVVLYAQVSAQPEPDGGWERDGEWER